MYRRVVLRFRNLKVVKVAVAILLLLALALPAAQAMVPSSNHDDCCCPLNKAKSCPMRGRQNSCGMRSNDAPTLVPLILREPAVMTAADAQLVPVATTRFDRERVSAPRRIARTPDSPPPRV